VPQRILIVRGAFSPVVLAGCVVLTACSAKVATNVTPGAEVGVAVLRVPTAQEMEAKKEKANRSALSELLWPSPRPQIYRITSFWSQEQDVVNAHWRGRLIPTASQVELVPGNYRIQVRCYEGEFHHYTFTFGFGIPLRGNAEYVADCLEVEGGKLRASIRNEASDRGWQICYEENNICRTGVYDASASGY
jgi:hypothetical protein